MTESGNSATLADDAVQLYEALEMLIDVPTKLVADSHLYVRYLNLLSLSFLSKAFLTLKS